MPERGEKQHFMPEDVSTAYKAAREVKGGAQIPNGDFNTTFIANVITIRLTSPHRGLRTELMCFSFLSPSFASSFL